MTPTGACAGLLRLSNYDLLPRFTPEAVLWLGAAAAALEPATVEETETLRTPKHLDALVQALSEAEWGAALLEHPYASRFIFAIRAIAVFKSVMPTLVKTSKEADVQAALTALRVFIPEAHPLARHLATLISKAKTWRLHARSVIASKGPIATSVVEAALLAARRIPVDLTDDEARLEVSRTRAGGPRASQTLKPPPPPFRLSSSTVAARGASAAV